MTTARWIHLSGAAIHAVVAGVMWAYGIPVWAVAVNAAIMLTHLYLARTRLHGENE